MTEDQERILNGRYRVESLIGRGGMADVYLSHDISLDRRVAVKMLRPDLARDPQFQTRFRREAQSSASLNHHNIVGVYDTGQEDVEDASQHPVKVPYMVMEFVDGVTLRHILHGTPRQTDHTDSRHTDPDGPSADFDDDATRAVPPPPPGSAHSDPSDSEDSDSGETDSDVLAIGDTGRVHEGPESLEPEEVEQPLRDKIEHALGRPLNEGEAAGYLTGILAALGYSHRKGIVHRDIKPSNVMVDQQGNIKVMDFGIARAVADSASTMTQTSAVVGTAQYLSPEQARGEVVDHRSDLYSAGCVLFELLTNRPPFQGDSPVAVAYQHVREQAPRVSDFNPMVSPAMESVVGRALTKEPGLRFQTASEFSAALQDALRGIPVYDEEETAAIGMVPAMAGAGAAGADPAPSTGAPLSARTPEDPALYAEAEDYPPRRRGRAGRVLLWLLLVLILAAGAAWALAEMLSPQRVEIPDIEGMSRTDAVSELNEQNLDPEIETEPHEDIDEDLAIRTDPGAGEQVDAESPITLYISAGQDSVVIPDGLQGQSEDEVRETFDELGLEIGEITDDTHPSVEEDRLISTDPEAGETVSQGSSVDLVMSNGQVVMPGVFNTNQYDAQAVLEDLELSVEFVESENGEYTPGTVIGQQVDGSSVQAGDLIPQQSTVTLSIATAPPPPPQDDGEDEDDPADEPTSDDPSESPTDDESEDPSESPTDDESEDPSESPTDDESEDPSESPTDEESEEPSESPTDEESETDEPSPSPSPSPTEDDEESDEPSPSPTENGSPTNDD